MRLLVPPVSPSYARATPVKQLLSAHAHRALCGVLAAVLFWPAAAHADDAALPHPLANPVDRDDEHLAERVKQLAGKPEAALPMLELFGHWDASSPERTFALIERIAADKRLSPQNRVLAEGLLAEANARMGRPAALTARFDALGYVTDFRVIGPFDNEGKGGFDTETPPEQGRLQAPDLQATYPGRERPVRWRDYPNISRRGYVSFSALMRPRENACGLAETFVHSERDQPLTLWIGSGGANKVYWNGEQVLRDEAYRAPAADRSAAVVAARKGVNRLLVKVCVANGPWGFYLRLGDGAGRPASGLRVEPTSNELLDVTKAKAPKLPKPPPTTLSVLEAAAKKPKPTAAALYDLARYLRYTGADDPAERRAKQLAARAAELAPTVEHLELASDLSEERAESMKFAQQAERLFAKDPGSLMMQAHLLASGPAPEDALPLLERIGKDAEPWAEAQQLRASIVRELELPAMAQRIVEDTIQVVGPTPQLLRQLADLQNANGAQDQSIESRRALLRVRYDDVGTRRTLISDALARLSTVEVLEHLDALSLLAPGTADTSLYLAEIYDALGRDDMVLSTYREAMAVVPEAPELLVGYGRALLRADQQEAAADALGRALALKPQDAATRELLEQIKPRLRPDEAYALPSDRVLASRRASAGYPSTVLTDLTVNTVFDNGLGSSFHQLAVQVHDDEGTRRYRTVPIQYDPDSQRVELRLARVYRKDGRVLESVRSYEQQLGEPWYRIYYDTRALVIVLPDLEPEDVIEVRYRVDDIAHRNLFADYYGDLHTLQGFAPAARVEYVLITPEKRKFFVHEPQMAGLRHERRVEGGQRIDRYVAENVPAIVQETDMPGLTDVSPYLHVSTYDTWQAVGRWWWGLVKDQLYADEALKKTVRDLIANAKTTREKVERIHHWVVTNTRYVGLEFGIHGYMPYRVPLIVQRGFGDCKDKASLLYTMMREAGVDARIVLLRTRRNGALATEPASLSIFDHAIAYVPELDLYLDGTAEHSGTTELPTQDQGVMVLVVGPDSAELRTTPVFDAERNRRTRTLEVQLAADGSAQVKGSEVVVGSEAAGYRDYYEAEGTRGERFERSLGSLYPGVKLEEQSFSALDNREQPVSYNYRIRVPQLARWDGDELRLEPTALHDLVQSMARLPSRHYDLDLQGNRAYKEDRLVKLPAGLSPSEVPAGGEVSSRFGRLSLQFTQGPGTITARTELNVSADRIGVQEYPEFRRWVEAADQLLKQRIGLRKERE